MPAMPGMPSMPNISAGGGGPSDAKGSSSGTSGFDSSNWAVNFAGTQRTDQAARFTPTSSQYQADQYGMPRYSAIPDAGYLPATGGGLAVSPALLMGGALILVLALRRKH